MKDFIVRLSEEEFGMVVDGLALLRAEMAHMETYCLGRNLPMVSEEFMFNKNRALSLEKRIRAEAGL